MKRILKLNSTRWSIVGDRHLRLAVTGLSRSGKTKRLSRRWLTSCHRPRGARLPLLSAVREERLLGVKRVPQRDLFPFYLRRGDTSAYGNPPCSPNTTRAASVEIRLALRYRSNDSLLRHFKDTDIVSGDCGLSVEWLLDLAHAGSGLFAGPVR